jgi:hypothetical protein
MSRKTFATAAYLFMLSFVPQAAVAQLWGWPPPPPPPHHVVPAPELDVGVPSFIMVGAAASLAYWRKRNS